ALQQRVERDLARHIATKATLVVEMVRVPFTEDVVRAPIRRMSMIAGARIDRELVEQPWVESRLLLDGRLGGGKEVERELDEVLIAATSHARSAHEQRYRPHPLVVIRFPARPRLQNGDRPMADVVIEPLQRARGNAHFVFLRSGSSGHFRCPNAKNGL